MGCGGGGAREDDRGRGMEEGERKIALSTGGRSAGRRLDTWTEGEGGMGGMGRRVYLWGCCVRVYLWDRRGQSCGVVALGRVFSSWRRKVNFVLLGELLNFEGNGKVEEEV